MSRRGAKLAREIEANLPPEKTVAARKAARELREQAEKLKGGENCDQRLSMN